ncbi:MAG: type I-C CRISPR-associated protein Cas8c/Csd1 [Chthoniobacterales bacterium]|nr:type I-C CRISPR-associated protein Cas8c/Csd1 [Chthoniobacterales bacterium]
MILQSLNQLYHRLAADARYGVPTPGYSVQRVTFCIVLGADGTLHEIEDARQTITETTKVGKTRTKQIARQMLVPGNGKPPGQGINPCTLWDNTAYLLGYTQDTSKKARAAQSFQACREHHLTLEPTINDPSFFEVCRFLEAWTPESAMEWQAKLDDFATTGFGVFRLLDQRQFVHDTPTFREWWVSRQNSAATDEIVAPCLVTGESLPIARLAEPAIKGVNGAAPGGAKLASFNLDAFESYGKQQTYNAPVSKVATFQYCNALNALLGGPQSHRHRIQIGDATTVFWTERETITESLFAEFLGGNIEPNEQSATTEEDRVIHQRLDAFLKILRQGGGAQVGELGDDPDTRFYILGLSGNVTRLSVRYWHVGSIAEMVDRLKAHYDALRIVRSRETDPEFPPLWMLLRQTAREAKDIPPLLSGVLMQSILAGTPYPQALYSAVLNRIRADHAVNYFRAAVIKAVLTRQPNSNHQIPMSLDSNRIDKGYLLGRLFAALEKTQEDALGIATVRERFYSSASATPGAVFPRILRTYQHHLAKLEGGHKVNRERLIQSIHAPLRSYPAHLNLEEQGLFAIGYYHQRQDFFTRKPPANEESPSFSSNN